MEDYTYLCQFLATEECNTPNCNHCHIQNHLRMTSMESGTFSLGQEGRPKWTSICATAAVGKVNGGDRFSGSLLVKMDVYPPN